jgi:hypothetical protein
LCVHHPRDKDCDRTIRGADNADGNRVPYIKSKQYGNDDRGENAQMRRGAEKKVKRP